MRKNASRLEDLRLGDLWTFLAAQRVGSVTAAARELSVTPSQVSKAIARLERQLEDKLITRSSRGIALTSFGRRLLPDIEIAAARLGVLKRADRASQVELTIAGASYLIGAFLAVIAGSHPRLRTRGLEIPPSLVRAYAAENIFDVALMGAGAEKLPPSWVSEEIGVLRKSLFASPRLAKRFGSARVLERDLLATPFILPIYNVAGRFVIADDDCPLPFGRRTYGHETQTIAVALDLATHTDQLVFGPVIAAKRQLAAGSLVEIHVEGWQVREPLLIAYNVDRVLAKVRASATKAVRAALRRLDPKAAGDA